MTLSLTSPLLGLNFQLHFPHQQPLLVIQPLSDDPLPALVNIELALAEAGYQQIQLQFTQPSLTLEQIERLHRLHYHKDGQLWHKTITYRKSVRLSVTEQCNFHCFFCHGEGVEMNVKRDSVDQSKLFTIIAQLAEHGYDDFTFTGGEPLLNWRTIEACLDYMQRIDYLPEITIVTNGERINARMITRLQAYPGKVRFNFSLHSLIDHDYLTIVHRQVKPNHGSDQLLTRTKEKIAMIAQAQIPFKLNIVLLKGLNTDRAQLQAILNYAVQQGALGVKFLELLITEPLKQYYPYFYRLSAVKEVLADQLSLLLQTPKKDVYQYQDSSLQVELQHCTCARGCNTCLLNRGATISATGKFYSCFLRPEQSMQLGGHDLVEAVAFGDHVIAQMARNYGDHSPIVIKDVQHCKQEQAYFYPLDETQKNKVETLLDGKLIRLREFSEQYFTHNELADNEYRKLSQNSYELTALEIHQRIEFVPDTQQLRTQFLHQGLAVQDKQAHQAYLLTQGYQLGAKLDWIVSFYQNAQQRYSISYNPQTHCWFLRTEHPFTELTLNLTPLSSMPFAWVITQLAAPSISLLPSTAAHSS